MLYKAFLSYSHAADDKLAPAIQSALHRFARPWYKLRAIRVFRDETSLSASPALWSSIEAALGESEFFLLLASPASAHSSWVQKETAWWAAHKGTSAMLILLSDGELTWDSESHDFDWNHTSALPSNLRGQFTEEPLWVNFRGGRNEQQLTLRNSQFRSAVLDVAAPLHGVAKDELDGEDVRQYHRTRRLVWLAVIVLAMLTFAMTAAFVYARHQRDIADERRRIATARLLAAQAELTRNSDPRFLTRSVLLAAESLRRTWSFEAVDTLRSGLQLLARPAFHVPVTTPVSSLAISPDGKRLGTVDSNKKAIEIWVLPESRLLVRIPLQERDWDVAFNPDVTLAAVGNFDRTVRLIDLMTSKPLSDLPGLKDTNLVAFSRDGKYFAAGTKRGLRFFEVSPSPFTAFRSVGELPDEAQNLAFSADNKHLIATEYETSKVWQVELVAGRLRFRDLGKIPTPFNGGMAQWQFSPNSQYVAAAVSDRTARVYEVATRKLVATLPHNSDVTDVVFTPDSQQLATATGDATVHVWELSSGTEIRRLESNSDVIAFSTDGRYLLAGSDRGVTFWDWRDNASSNGKITGNTSLGLVFTKDSRLSDATMLDLRFFDLRDSTKEVIVKRDDEERWDGFSPDGEVMVTETKDHKLVLWDLTQQQPTRFGFRQLPYGDNTGNRWRYVDVQITGNREYLMAFFDGSLHVWRLAAWDFLRSLDLPSSYQREFTGNGKRMIVASGDIRHSKNDAPHFVEVWDVETGRKLSEVRFSKPAGEREFKLKVAISADGSACAAAFSLKRFSDVKQNAAVHLFSCSDGHEITQYSHERTVNEIVFSPDGRYVATTSDDHTTRVLGVKGRKAPSVYLHDGPVSDAHFSPDSKYLLTGSYDRNARIWNVETGLEAARTTLGDTVTEVAFSHDGKWAAAAAVSGDVSWWLWRPEDLLDLACSYLLRNLSTDEWNRALPDDPPSKTCPNLP